LITLPTYDYYKGILQHQRMPLAFVDLDLLDENIKNIAKRAKGKKIRIASKSIRCLSIIKRILNSNTIYQGVMCFHPEEACFLADEGLDDLLVAYPTVDQKAITNITSHLKKGRQIYLMCDLAEHIQLINKIGEAENCIIPICIDLDMSVAFPALHFGVYRSSITNLQSLKQLVTVIKQNPFVKLAGAMGYEAQIAGVGDNMPNESIKNQVVRLLKKQSIKKIATWRTQAVNYLLAEGFKLDFVNGGGTGSLESTCLENALTEATAGSGFFASGLFDNYTNFKHLPAAAFAIPISRKPKKGIYTCSGGGYIASGPVGIDKCPKPYLPKGIQLFNNEGTGEVQTPIKTDLPLNLGDPILFRHSKAGELCERFNHLHLIANNEIVNTVPTYRGQGKCFM